MRIDRINLSTDQDEQGNVRSASVWFENANELGERINGNFGITIDQYSKITNKEMTIREIAEAKIIELFEITTDQDSMAGIVELRKKLESKDEELQALTQELQTQTEMIMELTLMLSQMTIPETEEIPEAIPGPGEVEDNEEVEEPNKDENSHIDDNPDIVEGGEGGE